MISTWNLAKTNLRFLFVPYLLTAIITGAIGVQIVVMLILEANGINSGSQLSFGQFLWLLPLFAGIFIPARNFRRIMNLGGKRNSFFWGSLIAYAVLAVVVSIANTAIFYAIDRPIIQAETFMPFYPFYPDVFVYGEPGHIGGIANVIDVFGWVENGVFTAFLQQFAFLFMLGTFVHTLTAIQDKWYGWLTCVLLVAVISVFTPIAPLRAALVWFFNLIIFNDTAALQIAACVAIGLVVYIVNKPVLARKRI